MDKLPIPSARRAEAGFTLIEIAIVVVIVGLLLGGILKGQEMIRNARAHNIADQTHAIKAALLGFQDRFRALPGDYSKASVNLPGLDGLPNNCAGELGKLGPGNGDGDNRIGGQPGEVVEPKSGCKRANELAFVWRHLTAAGFLSGSFDGQPAGIDEEAFNCRAATCLTNAYNSGMILSYNNQQFTNDFNDPKSDGNSNQLTSGRFIPVGVLAELDRKIDDGDPSTGSFRIADFFVGGKGSAGQTSATSCGNDVHTTSSITGWNINGQNIDCGGIFLF